MPIPATVPTSAVQRIFRVLLGIFMVLAGTGHLTFQREMFQAQVPDWVPLSKDLVVILSGLAEITFGLAVLLLRRYCVWVGLALALFFVAIFPGNLHQWQEGIDAFGLDSDRKRFLRLFFQPLLILWALWSTGVFRAGKEWRSGITS
jgi:uncharacterized membrane protein